MDDDDGIFGFELEENVTVTLDKAVAGLSNIKPVFQRFHQEMITRIDNTFEVAGAPGSVERGGFDFIRGIEWEPLAPQRTNKSGKTVPVWGGTVIAGTGGKQKTLGKLRPSGKRIKRGDAINQDTGRYRQRAATGYVAITNTSLTFGPNLNYASALEAIRPLLFITESDRELFEKLLTEHIFGEM